MMKHRLTTRCRAEAGDDALPVARPLSPRAPRRAASEEHRVPRGPAVMSKARRHRQQSALAGAPELSGGREVMRVARVCGENVYELEGGDGARGLYALPARLRHVVFIRPRSLVLAARDPAARGAVAGDIEAALLDCHLPELRRHPRWPPRFAEGGTGGGGGDGGGEEEKRAEEVAVAAGNEAAAAGVVGAGGGAREDSSSEESELEGNPNRRKADMFSDSEDDV